jgi:tetratricopeptide (TPR) repeat protein
VSLGGYWPDYTHRRYYWYGCHPYRWYGDYPPGYVIAGDTYNYYYYNDAPQGEELTEAHRRFEEAPPAEPSDESQVDRYFEQAVKAFEAGDYAAAAAKFRDARDREPGDVVLPFACVQALFAGGEHKAAADGLREALMKASPEKEGVFFPRGLYPDDSILQQHIEQLTRAVQLDPSDSDLMLLLGYQLLGTGKLNEAGGYLRGARLDDKNSRAATVLINLLEKLTKADSKNVDSDRQPQPNSKPDSTREAGNPGATSEPKRADVDISALAMAADDWLAQD